MKTRIFFIGLLLLLITSRGYAQWGVKGGVDYGTLAKASLSNYRVGFHIGPTYDFRFSDNLYLQSGMLFSLHSFGFDPFINMVKGTVDKYSLEIPLVASLRPALTDNVRLVVDAGWYFKYGLFGDKKYEMIDKSISQESSFKAYNRFDTGVTAGLGIEYSKIYAGINFQYGLTNAEKAISYHNMIFRLSLGYRF